MLLLQQYSVMDGLFQVRYTLNHRTGGYNCCATTSRPERAQLIKLALGTCYKHTPHGKLSLAAPFPTLAAMIQTYQHLTLG